MSIVLVKVQICFKTLVRSECIFQTLYGTGMSNYVLKRKIEQMGCFVIIVEYKIKEFGKAFSRR